MGLPRPVLIVITLVALAAGLAVGDADARPRRATPRTFAPAAAATIHPGVQLRTDGAQCTANFIFDDGVDLYIGYAAHCASTGPATDTNGCTAKTLPLGTPVEISGADRPGRLAYSSWVAMQAAGESDEATCASNDFALVRIDPADASLVNPSVPTWGGPVAVAPSDPAILSRVYAYGSSELRLGLTLVSPKTGVLQANTDDGRNHAAQLGPAPDVPGDSGSGLLDSEGRALGALSRLSAGFSTVDPLSSGATSNYADIGLALEYARDHGMAAGLRLVPGTEAFQPDALPVG